MNIKELSNILLSKKSEYSYRGLLFKLFVEELFFIFSKFLLVRAQDYEYWYYESSVIKTIKRSYFVYSLLGIYFLCLINVSKLYFGLRVTTTFNSWIKNTEYNNEANDQVSDFKWHFPLIALSGSLF